MNWLARSALLALLLVAVTLPMKLAANRAPVDLAGEEQAKAAALGRFLQTQRLSGLQFVRPNQNAAAWTGWRFAAGGCRAFVIPDVSGPDGLQMLRRVDAPGAQTIYIYRGQASPDYPYLGMGFDQVMTRLVWAVHPARWRRPFLVVGFYSGDCRGVLGWDWSPLSPD